MRTHVLWCNMLAVVVRIYTHYVSLIIREQRIGFANDGEYLQGLANTSTGSITTGGCVGSSCVKYVVLLRTASWSDEHMRQPRNGALPCKSGPLGLS